MAKQKAVAAKMEEIELAGKKVGAFSFGFEKYQTPLVAPPLQKVTGGIAFFGVDNALDVHIVNQFETSPTHCAIVSSAAKYVTGDSFTVEGANYEETKILFGSSNPRRFLKLVAKCRMLYSAFGILLTYSKAGILVRMEYVEYGQIRQVIEEVTDESGVKTSTLTGYKVAPRWKRSGTLNVRDFPAYDPDKVLIFTNGDSIEYGNFERKPLQGETVSYAPQQLYVFEGESFGSSFYTTPEWWPADKAIKFDALFHDFHTNNLSKGFMPTLIMEIQGVNTQEDKDEYDSKLKKTGGTDGDRVIAIYPESTQEGKPTLFIHPIDNHMHDGKFEKIHHTAVQSILTAHQLSSPVLAGIPTSGNLQPNAGERESALNLYMSNVIRDARQDILDALQQIFSECGRPTWTPKVKDSNPYSMTTEISTPDAKL